MSEPVASTSRGSPGSPQSVLQSMSSELIKRKAEQHMKEKRLYRYIPPREMSILRWIVGGLYPKPCPHSPYSQVKFYCCLDKNIDLSSTFINYLTKPNCRAVIAQQYSDIVLHELSQMLENDLINFFTLHIKLTQLSKTGQIVPIVLARFHTWEEGMQLILLDLCPLPANSCVDEIVESITSTLEPHAHMRARIVRIIIDPNSLPNFDDLYTKLCSALNLSGYFHEDQLKSFPAELCQVFDDSLNILDFALPAIVKLFKTKSCIKAMCKKMEQKLSGTVNKLKPDSKSFYHALLPQKTLFREQNLLKRIALFELEGYTKGFVKDNGSDYEPLEDLHVAMVSHLQLALLDEIIDILNIGINYVQQVGNSHLGAAWNGLEMCRRRMDHLVGFLEHQPDILGEVGTPFYLGHNVKLARRTEFIKLAIDIIDCVNYGLKAVAEVFFRPHEWIMLEKTPTWEDVQRSIDYLVEHGLGECPAIKDIDMDRAQKEIYLLGRYLDTNASSLEAEWHARKTLTPGAKVENRWKLIVHLAPENFEHDQLSHPTISELARIVQLIFTVQPIGMDQKMWEIFEEVDGYWRAEINDRKVEGADWRTVKTALMMRFNLAEYGTTARDANHIVTPIELDDLGPAAASHWLQLIYDDFIAKRAYIGRVASSDEGDEKGSGKGKKVAMKPTTTIVKIENKKKGKKAREGGGQGGQSLSTRTVSLLPTVSSSIINDQQPKVRAQSSNTTTTKAKMDISIDVLETMIFSFVNRPGHGLEHLIIQTSMSYPINLIVTSLYHGVSIPRTGLYRNKCPHEIYNKVIHHCCLSRFFHQNPQYSYHDMGFEHLTPGNCREIIQRQFSKVTLPLLKIRMEPTVRIPQITLHSRLICQPESGSLVPVVVARFFNLATWTIEYVVLDLRQMDSKTTTMDQMVQTLSDIIESHPSLKHRVASIMMDDFSYFPFPGIYKRLCQKLFGDDDQPKKKTLFMDVYRPDFTSKIAGIFKELLQQLPFDLRAILELVRTHPDMKAFRAHLNELTNGLNYFGIPAEPQPILPDWPLKQQRYPLPSLLDSQPLIVELFFASEFRYFDSIDIFKKKDQSEGMAKLWEFEQSPRLNRFHLLYLLELMSNLCYGLHYTQEHPYSTLGTIYDALKLLEFKMKSTEATLRNVDRFGTYCTMSTLEPLERKELKTSVSRLIKHCYDRFKSIRDEFCSPHDWIRLDAPPTMPQIEASMDYFTQHGHQTMGIDREALSREIAAVSAYLSSEKLQEWSERTSADIMSDNPIKDGYHLEGEINRNRWRELFYRVEPRIDNLLRLVQLIFTAIPIGPTYKLADIYADVAEFWSWEVRTERLQADWNVAKTAILMRHNLNESGQSLSSYKTMMANIRKRPEPLEGVELLKRMFAASMIAIKVNIREETGDEMGDSARGILDALTQKKDEEEKEKATDAPAAEKAESTKPAVVNKKKNRKRSK